MVDVRDPDLEIASDSPVCRDRPRIASVVAHRGSDTGVGRTVLQLDLHIADRTSARPTDRVCVAACPLVSRGRRRHSYRSRHLAVRPALVHIGERRVARTVVGLYLVPTRLVRPHGVIVLRHVRGHSTDLRKGPRRRCRAEDLVAVFIAHIAPRHTNPVAVRSIAGLHVPGRARNRPLTVSLHNSTSTLGVDVAVIPRPY